MYDGVAPDAGPNTTQPNRVGYGQSSTVTLERDADAAWCQMLDPPIVVVEIAAISLGRFALQADRRYRYNAYHVHIV